MQRHDQDPSALAWLVAFISLVLPWAAAGLALAGLWRVARGEAGGWWYVAAAGVLLIADILIDFIWAHPSVLKTDQPDLNRRAAQLVGRVGIVEEAITHGRGKVRIGDTLWMVEGPDAPAGAKVRVTAARGDVLRVELAPMA
ncbi:MAG: NfeD family protein [Hyphomonadaceae bacterium]|nr:NfeD family protein [Hyphomonadaceae bacterium]